MTNNEKPKSFGVSLINEIEEYHKLLSKYRKLTKTKPDIIQLREKEGIKIDKLLNGLKTL